MVNIGPFVQVDQGFHCPFTESMDTVVYVDIQRILRSDCMDGPSLFAYSIRHFFTHCTSFDLLQIAHVGHNMRNMLLCLMICAQPRLRAACTFTQDQFPLPACRNLHCLAVSTALSKEISYGIPFQSDLSLC